MITLRVFWIVWILYLSIIYANAMKVSLYGHSFITMPLQEAKMSTTIRLKFRTLQENALIFLAAGRTDYCLLKLELGQISLMYKVHKSVIELRSPNETKWNDLLWHDVAVQRYENNITMQIDKHIIRKLVPDDIGELGIHFGTFLGGVGDFSESYLREIDNFRGCISDVFYNNINILKRARERTNHATSVGVTWNCSSEFEAEVYDSISFIEENSFMVLKGNPNNSGESWRFDIRTIEEVGAILVNFGADFALVEVMDSKLRLLFGKGHNIMELLSPNLVSDGNWHNVIIRYNTVMVELLVDNISSKLPFPNENNANIDLDQYYYFGRTKNKIRRRSYQNSLRISDVSFKGCIRNIVFNDQKIGLPHVKASNGVMVHCVWKYPCIEKLPCINMHTLNSGGCHQYGLDEFVCHCDQAYCLKADYTEPYKIFTHSHTQSEIELLRISPVQLTEGGTVYFSALFIELLFNYTKVGLPESSILFHIVQYPKYGRLLRFNSDSGNSANCKIFSLLDLTTDKIKYVHNGLEHFNDHITMDLQINEDTVIPDHLFGKHRFVLHLNITPVNDGPTLHIGSKKILRITQCIPKVIGTDLLNAQDPDSSPQALIFSVLNATSSEWINGRFEVNGKPSLKFSQLDLNKGSVMYYFNNSIAEDLSFEFLVQVSDGIETSEIVMLPVSVHPLQLEIINNTGLEVVHKSSSIITPWNLAVIANSDEENIDFKYIIKKHPQYGSVQKLRPIDSSWVAADSFTNSQIVLGYVRYSHTRDFPVQDEFKFTASYGSVMTQDFDFRITFTKLRIVPSPKEKIYIKGATSAVISSGYLAYRTIPIPTFPRGIIYTILKPTRYGNIFVHGHQKQAEKMDSFTQNDIDKDLIRYQTHRTSFSHFIDILEFMVSVSECDNIVGKIEIAYNPDESLTESLSYQTKETLEVKEGAASPLMRSHFEIQFRKLENLTFIVTQPSEHGYLCDHKESTSVSKFSLGNLDRGDVYYCHDDSESEKDSLELLIISSEDIDFQYVCEINVDITLMNDNIPYPAFERVFHVVCDALRIITENDLLYLDMDIDTNLSEIRYIHVSCFNGKFYRSGFITDRFTQDDIKNRLIYFKHDGPTVGMANFIVSDGLHEISGVMEIQASDPFIKVSPSNASIVQEGKSVLLTQADMSIKTNLGIKLNEILYTVTKPPSYGILTLSNNWTINFAQSSKNYTSIYNFTQMDLEKEQLVYWNTEVASMDKIVYQVLVKNVSACGELAIRIYPAAYWEPLKVQKNNTLYVEESTSVLISKDILEVVHPNISPGDITYLVKVSPLHGYLEIQSMTSDDEYNCKVFDQSTINSEKMFYIQAGVNQSSDYFIFDVTNGITWLRNLILKIVIIPENIYIETKYLKVVEGKIEVLNANLIQPYSEYYKTRILEYKIIQHPSFGYVAFRKSRVTRFSQKQLESEAVQYIHDGSENSTDSMKLIAIARNKESLPFTLQIEVIPVNDEPPVIVTNTGIQVWNGGKYSIKNTDIMARDPDSSPENLIFLIKYIYGGYLAHIDKLNSKVEQFTQRQIDNQEICFVHHANSKRNEIGFIITDGLFNTTEQIVYITPNPVILSKVHNEELHVFPLSKKQISPEHLQFECSDKTRRIQYNITLSPQLGRILYENAENGHIQGITEFTQNDIYHGRIIYEHTSTMLELKTNDSFSFSVYTENANRLLDEKFNIEISVSTGGLLRFLPISKIHIDEGGSAAIKLDFSKILEYLKTRAGMTDPELYIKLRKPMHGSVTSVINKEDSTILYPEDFISQKVYYFHDHSDSSNDIITMTVFLMQGNILLCNLSIPVIINPINDQPFVLVTQSPNINVVEKENVTITKENLLTTDLDTNPENIIYEVISGPPLGLLMKISSKGDAQDLLGYGNQFTQADINNERIVYVHYGSPRTTSFYFKVSDGKFEPAYEIFNINVQTTFINCAKEQIQVKIQQGTSTAALELNHISINTNVNWNRIHYNITNSPLNGIILFNHQPTLHFNQTLLTNQDITYMQTDMSKTNDTFQVFAYVAGTNYGTICEIFIQVEPFIKINAISIVEGDKIKLSSIIASESLIINKLSKYNPKISITARPKFGTIRKIIRNSGEIENLNERDINAFTYKELKSGVIFYVAKILPENIFLLMDSFNYLVSMKSVQPAQSSVSVEIHSSKPVVRSDHTVNLEKSTELTLSYLIAPCTLLFLLLFSTVIIIVVRCRYKSKKEEDIQKDSPLALPRPPDFVMLNNNRIYSPSETESIPATASSTPLPCLSHIPHCKVTPVGNHQPEFQRYDLDEDATDELNETQQMVPSEYQSYMENSNWSSSYDAQNDFEYQTAHIPHPATNPLLRRNQYWV